MKTEKPRLATWHREPKAAASHEQEQREESLVEISGKEQHDQTLESELAPLPAMEKDSTDFHAHHAHSHIHHHPGHVVHHQNHYHNGTLSSF